MDADKLNQMLSLEVAASRWFSELSPDEQRVYLKAHPASKMTTRFGLQSMRQQTEKLIGRHDLRAKYHAGAAFRSENQAEKAWHTSQSELHRRAQKHYEGATYAYSVGDPKSGHAHAARGASVAAKIDAGYRAGIHAPTRAAKTSSLVHSGRSAISASNDLIKHFGAKRDRAMFGNSNPYSDTQSLHHSVPPARLGKLVEHLKASGWSHEVKNGTSDRGATYHELKHPEGGHISMLEHTGFGTIGKKPFVRATVYGKKKAKRSNIPYYD